MLVILMLIVKVCFVLLMSLTAAMGPTEWETGTYPRMEVQLVVSYTDNRGNSDFFSRNRGQSVVRLLRYHNPVERGRFHCELFDSAVYVNICELYSLFHYYICS